MKNKRILRNLPGLLGGLVVTSVAVGMVIAITQLMNKPAQMKKTVQQVTLITPPSPPPPKIEQPPPEPEMKEEVVEEENIPEDIPDASLDMPEGDLLGLDADGGAGGDGFGLIGKKGGKDFLNGDKYGWYSGVLQQDILDFLYEKKDIRLAKYSIRVNIWIATDGRVKKVRLLDSTGKPKLDKSIKLALAGLDKLSEKPPAKLPQPVSLRITSRL